MPRQTNRKFSFRMCFASDREEKLTLNIVIKIANQSSLRKTTKKEKKNEDETVFFNGQNANIKIVTITICSFARRRRRRRPQRCNFKMFHNSIHLFFLTHTLAVFVSCYSRRCCSLASDKWTVCSPSTALKRFLLLLRSNEQPMKYA